MTRRAVVVSCLMLAGSATEALAQKAVFIVRHAERVDESSDSPLSAVGERRAEVLAVMLADAGVTAIYTTEYQRTVKTGEPLARRLGLSIARTSRPPAELVPEIRARHEADTVLIVGHSNTVPDILAAFGHSARVTIANDEYTNLFVLIPGQGGPPTMVRLRF
jgi:broad specificity phosphatase PhoE